MERTPLINDHDDNGNKITDFDAINALRQTQLSTKRRTSLSKRENERDARKIRNDNEYPDDSSIAISVASRRTFRRKQSFYTISSVDESVIDGPWASEKTPLLQRTNDQARFLGAKSFIDPSYYTSEHLNQSRRSSTFSYAKSLESNARSKNFGNKHFANKDQNGNHKDRKKLSNGSMLTSSHGSSSSENKIENDEILDKSWHWTRMLKVAVLTSACIVITVFLLLIPEKTIQGDIITVANGKSAMIDLDVAYLNNGRNSSGTEKLVELKMVGPFLSEFQSLSPSSLLHRKHFYTRELLVTVGNKTATHDDQTVTDFAVFDILAGTDEEIMVSTYLDLNEIDLTSNEHVSLDFKTNSKRPIAFQVQVTFVSHKVNSGVIYGWIILIAMYGMIIFEIAHRTIITMIMATASITVLAMLNERPTLDEVLTWIDVETLTLLFSMMLIVSVVSETGIFNYMGYWAFRITKGKVWPLLIVLSVITAVVSAFLDNVTTVLLLTPVVIQLCESISIDPVRILIAVCIFSNIGGTATSVGDPPNVLIANDPTVIESGVTFSSFMLHMTPVCIIVGLCTYLMLRFILYRKLEDEKEDEEIHALQHEIIIWNKTLQSINSLSKEEQQVKEIAISKVEELQEELDKRVEERSRHGKTFDEIDLFDMQEQCRVTDKPLLIKSLAVLTVVILLFFLQNFPSLNLSLGWISLIGAITLLILQDKAELEAIIARVEWTTLIFFATLFVVMEALNQLGFLGWIGDEISGLIQMVDEKFRLTVAILLIVWVSGIASAFVDNIPFTTMMIPVIINLSEDLGLPLPPLVYSLALGACLGGNGTLIGSSANLVCAGVAEQHGYSYSFKDFFVIGMPINIMSLTISSIYLIICHVALDWNT